MSDNKRSNIFCVLVFHVKDTLQLLKISSTNIMIDLIYAFSGKRGKILRNQSKRSKLCTHVCHDVFTMLQYMWREDSIIPKWIAVLWVHLRLQIKATFSQRSALCVWDSMDCKNSVIQSVYVRIVIIRLISCSKLY